ncbi:MAG: lysophospholipid acyltransferase family protein [Candidatus Omnitrophota bacterium]
MKIKTRRYHIYYWARIALFLIGVVPRKIALAIADFLGRIAFKMLNKHRNKAMENLSEVLHCGEDRSAKIARGVFINMAKNGIDWIRSLSLKWGFVNKIVTEVSGLDRLDKALESGNGAILMASHFGNWELMSIYLTLRGYNGAIIARRIYFHKYDKILNQMRTRFGVKVIYRDESPKKILNVLKNGQILGMLADQDVDSVSGVFVDFFNRPAYTPSAPVKIAMKTGALLVPAFMIRKKDDTYKLIIEEPIDAGSSDGSAEEIIKYTQAWTAVLEKYVKEYPEQWVWIHDRWKTKKVVSR